MPKAKMDFWTYLSFEDLHQHVEKALADNSDLFSFNLTQLEETCRKYTYKPFRHTHFMGRVRHQRREVNISTFATSTATRKDTILHELAHIIVRWHFVIPAESSHGKTWKKIATALGTDPTATGHDEGFNRDAAAKNAAKIKPIFSCPKCNKIYYGKKRRPTHLSYYCTRCPRRTVILTHL